MCVNSERELKTLQQNKYICIVQQKEECGGQQEMFPIHDGNSPTDVPLVQTSLTARKNIHCGPKRGDAEKDGGHC